MVTSPLLYKLTRLAHPCQCWPLVLNGDICLYWWPPPVLGAVCELHCQVQEAEAHTLPCLTPSSGVGCERREAAVERLTSLYLTQEEVGIILAAYQSKINPLFDLFFLSSPVYPVVTTGILPLEGGYCCFRDRL